MVLGYKHIYHFEKYNIPIDSELLELILAPVEELDTVLIIPECKIGTVVDISGDSFIEEYCFDAAEDYNDKWKLFYKDRAHIRLVHKGAMKREESGDIWKRDIFEEDLSEEAYIRLLEIYFQTFGKRFGKAWGDPMPDKERVRRMQEALKTGIPAKTDFKQQPGVIY